MNRFLSRQPLRSSALKAVFSFGLTAVVLILSCLGLDSMLRHTVDEQRRTLQDAVRRSIVQCYIFEGSYPEDLDYLESHYPLIYDDSRFFIDYRPIGENIMPEVTIITLTP